MALAHLNLKMSDKHFDLGKQYFEEALIAFKVEGEDFENLMKMFEAYRGPCLKGTGP